MDVQAKHCVDSAVLVDKYMNEIQHRLCVGLVILSARQVVPIKVLGILALVDEQETDWKVRARLS